MGFDTYPDAPSFSIWLVRLMRPLNRFFDWLYHSRYNPLYRSGTLAAGLMLVLLATGTYLLFFYSVSDPYTSLLEIETGQWLSRLMRSVHRYATDALIVSVIFHVLQLLCQ